MLPGHFHATSASIASGGMVSMVLPMRRAWRETKWRTRMGMSAARSRSGGAEDRKDLEPVVEVAAELLFCDHFGQVAIGGGDEAHVDGDGPRAAQALDLPLLQRAQQLGLQVERHLADLVEKERALVRQLEAADLARDGAGERALFVAEELAFEQPGGNGRAIQLDEGALAARAQAMDGARQQFFAGSGLALDEHGGIGGRDGLNLRAARCAGRCFRPRCLRSGARD